MHRPLFRLFSKHGDGAQGRASCALRENAAVARIERSRLARKAPVQQRNEPKNLVFFEACHQLFEISVRATIVKVVVGYMFCCLLR